VPAACGGESGPNTHVERLSAAQQSIVVHAEVSLHSYCAKLALYLAERRAAPSDADSRQVGGNLDRLIDVARDQPEARARTGETMRQVLGDMAEDLEGSNCSGSFEQKLEEGLAALPSSD
jgi:hypothetical protein